jgi:hypothetical protein
MVSTHQVAGSTPAGGATWTNAFEYPRLALLEQMGVAVETTLAVDDIAALARGWQLRLRARNRSPQTIAAT